MSKCLTKCRLTYLKYLSIIGDLNVYVLYMRLTYLKFKSNVYIIQLEIKFHELCPLPISIKDRDEHQQHVFKHLR